MIYIPSITTEWIIITVVAALLLAVFLPKRMRFVLNGIILFIAGYFDIIYYFDKIDINWKQTPLIVFVVVFTLMQTSSQLLSESIKERTFALKNLTFIFALILSALVIIPELYAYGVINYNFPKYPGIVDSIVYLIGGLIAIIAPFYADNL